MEIGAPKSKIMVKPAAPSDQADIEVGDVVLEKGNDFTYMGAHISQDATSLSEVKTRLAIATNEL